MSTLRFIGPANPAPAGEAQTPLYPPPIAGRFDPSGQQSSNGQDLAAAIAALGRSPQGSSTALAANLAAEALLEYARRNSLEGQANPGGQGGGAGAFGQTGTPPQPGDPDPSIAKPAPSAQLNPLLSLGLFAGGNGGQGSATSW